MIINTPALRVWRFVEEIFQRRCPSGRSEAGQISKDNRGEFLIPF